MTSVPVKDYSLIIQERKPLSKTLPSGSDRKNTMDTRQNSEAIEKHESKKAPFTPVYVPYGRTRRVRRATASILRSRKFADYCRTLPSLPVLTDESTSEERHAYAIAQARRSQAMTGYVQMRIRS